MATRAPPSEWAARDLGVGGSTCAADVASGDVDLNPSPGAKIGERALDDRVPGTDDNLPVAVREDLFARRFSSRAS